VRKKLIRSGRSLAVALPTEIVRVFRLKAGMEVDVEVDQSTGAVTVRPGPVYFEGGKITPRFERMARQILDRRANVFRALAKHDSED
jgi:virulence-associated protein VagC